MLKRVKYSKGKFEANIFFEMFSSSVINSSFCLEIFRKHKVLVPFYCFSFSRYPELAEHQLLSNKCFGFISTSGCCTAYIIIEYIHFFESIRVLTVFKGILNYHSSS